MPFCLFTDQPSICNVALIRPGFAGPPSPSGKAFYASSPNSAQVEAPVLYCTSVNGLAAGSSFVNVADVGGVYNGQWVQAVSRWVTTVYGKPEPLPRTGY